MAKITITVKEKKEGGVSIDFGANSIKGCDEQHFITKLTEFIKKYANDDLPF